MKSKLSIITLILMLCSVTSSVLAAEPLIIQSQVKGTQEQPNVIYIMPWQGVEQIIEVKGKKRTIKLPKFDPVHPSAFKSQVITFANKQRVSKVGNTTTNTERN